MTRLRRHDERDARHEPPVSIHDLCLDVLRANADTVAATIARGLAEDPDFALRFLRLVAEIQHEIGPTAGLGGQISIHVTTNLDGASLAADAPRVMVDVHALPPRGAGDEGNDAG